MTRVYWLFVFATILALSARAYGAPALPAYTGVCVPPNITQMPITGLACLPFLSSSLLTLSTASGTLTGKDSQHNKTVYYVLRPAFPLLPLDCYRTLMSFECTTNFNPCVKVYLPEFDQEVAVGVKPCQSLCWQQQSLCRAFFDVVNVTLVACRSSPSVVSYNAIGTGSAAFQVPGPCRDTVYPVGQIPLATYAPPQLADGSCTWSFLGRKKNPSLEENDSTCWLKCPDASYSDEEWDNLALLIRVGSSLSFVSMVFLISSYLTHYDKRKFPSNIHVWEFFSCLMLAIAFLLNGSRPQENVWCNDGATYATQNNNKMCTAQGILFIFFGIAVASWCCVIAFVMFRAIVFNKKVKDLEHLTKFFHIFGWGVPLVLVITAVAKNKIGYGAPLAWCFIQFKGFGYGEDEGASASIDYYVFYIPIGILFFFILVLFWATVAKIIHVRRLQVAKNTSRKSSRTLQAQVRVLLFIFVVKIICFTVFEWRLQIEAENGRHGIDSVGWDWVVCKIKRQIGMATKALCPTAMTPARINFGHTAAESFLFSAVGFFMFIAFGSDFGIYKHWFKIFTLVFQGQFKQAKEFVVYGKDPFTSTPSTSKTKSGSTTGSKNNNSEADSRGDKKEFSATTSDGESRSELQESPAPTDAAKPPQMFYLA